MKLRSFSFVRRRSLLLHDFAAVRRDAVQYERQQNKNGDEPLPSEMVQDDACAPSPKAGPQVIAKQIHGNGHGTFWETVVAYDPVARHVDHEKIKREESQP